MLWTWKNQNTVCLIFSIEDPTCIVKWISNHKIKILSLKDEIVEQSRKYNLTARKTKKRIWWGFSIWPNCRQEISRKQIFARAKSELKTYLRNIRQQLWIFQVFFVHDNDGRTGAHCRPRWRKIEEINGKNADLCYLISISSKSKPSANM